MECCYWDEQDDVSEEDQAWMDKILDEYVEMLESPELY
jgi:hypothetical protein